MRDFLCSVDIFIFFELVFHGSFHACESFFQSGMYTNSSVSSAVMILCNMCSPKCSKVCKFTRYHCNRRACISAVKRRGTKRENTFLIPPVTNNVYRVPLLTFRRFVTLLVVILLSFWMISPALTLFFH